VLVKSYLSVIRLPSYYLIIIYFNFFFPLAGGKKFSPVITLLPVFPSNSFLAFFATDPPFFPALAFSITLWIALLPLFVLLKVPPML